MNDQKRTFEIIDTHTQKRVGKPYSNLHKAHHRADKLDLEYGAIRYHVRPVKENTK